MTGKPEAPERLSLSRWSRRKLEAEAERQVAPAGAPSTTPASATPPVPAPARELPTRSAPQLSTRLSTQLSDEPPGDLPSVESLSFDSDFTPFLRPGVDEKLKRAALKQLLRDPRFNVMDGLDVYIDDYTKADPISPGIVQDLLHRGFTAVAAAPNWPVEEQTASSAPPPSVTGPSAETLPAPETTSASSAIASAEPEPRPEPTPEQPDPSRSS